jgi:hypothetical protein
VADVASGTLVILSAAALGNILVATQVPALRHGVGLLGRIMVRGQLAPETIAAWALGKRPVAVLITLLLSGAVIEALLILLTPWPRRILATALAQATDTAEDDLEAQLRAHADVVSVYRRGLLGQGMRGLAAQCVTYLLIGAFAAAAAWVAAVVLNAYSSGFIPWMLLVVFAVFWLFFTGILSAVKEALDDDATRETEAAAAKLLVTDK